MKLHHSRVSAAVLVSVVLAVTTACSADVAPDSIGAATSSAATGTLQHVMTPAGRVEVVLGAPVDRLGPADTGTDKEYDAADGERLVLVEWWLERTLAPLVAPPDSFTPGLDPEGIAADLDLAVVLDSERVVLPALPDAGTTARTWVSVPDDLDPVVEVAYDGLTQRLDPATGTVDPTVASAYDDLGLGSVEVLRCRVSGEEPPPGISFDRSCTAQVVAGLPFVEGPGWAAPGTTWALFRVTHSDLADIVPPVDSAFYDDEVGTVPEARCGTEEAVLVDGGDAQQRWFACPVVEEGELEVTATVSYTHTLDRNGADDVSSLAATLVDEFTASFTIPGPAS